MPEAGCFVRRHRTAFGPRGAAAGHHRVGWVGMGLGGAPGAASFAPAGYPYVRGIPATVERARGGTPLACGARRPWRRRADGGGGVSAPPAGDERRLVGRSDLFHRRRGVRRPGPVHLGRDLVSPPAEADSERSALRRSHPDRTARRVGRSRSPEMAPKGSRGGPGGHWMPKGPSASGEARPPPEEARVPKGVPGSAAERSLGPEGGIHRAWARAPARPGLNPVLAVGKPTPCYTAFRTERIRPEPRGSHRR